MGGLAGGELSHNSMKEVTEEWTTTFPRALNSLCNGLIMKVTRAQRCQTEIRT